MLGNRPISGASMPEAGHEVYCSFMAGSRREAMIVGASGGAT